ncbi:hypothetical protein JCM21900_002037 [Sporobolomyces salmonicolor]
MNNKLTRSLSRVRPPSPRPSHGQDVDPRIQQPFSGFTNYLRPHLHSERGISSKRAQELDQQRRLSGGVTSTHFVEDFADDPSTTDDELQDQSISFEPITDTSISSYDSDYETLNFPCFTTNPFQQSRQWKECSPVLEDPEREAAEGSGYLLRQPAQIPDDSLVDPDRSLSVFGTPEKCSSSPWHACHTLPEHDSPAKSEPTAVPSPDAELIVEETSSVYSRTPSLIGEDESAFEHPTPRSSEDSHCGPTTPDTSLPLSIVESDFGWHKGKRKATEVEIASPSSSTPPRPQLVELEVAVLSSSTPPRPQFVEVVETCPTPPSAPQVRAENRSRSLLKSGLAIDFAVAEEEAYDGEGEADETFLSSSRYVTPWGSATDLIPEQQPRTSTEHGPKQGPADYPSYDPQLYSDAAHFDSYTRRPRSAFAPPVALDSPETLPFPTLSATDLVSSLLSSHPPHALRPSSPSASPVLSHLRPVPAPHPPSPRSPRPASSSSYSARCAAAAPVVPLRAQPSASTLYSYDLAHLPAPHTPRERPYKVRAWRLLMPTALLGGGRGSGEFGDVWGAVERKGEGEGEGEGRAREPPAAATRRRRRRSSLCALRGGLASVGETERFEDDHERENRTTPPPPPPPPPPLKRGASLRRSLSRWAGLANEAEDGDPKLEEAKHRRRSSLGLSLLGRREGAEERLEHWVSVVVA